MGLSRYCRAITHHKIMLSIKTVSSSGIRVKAYVLTPYVRLLSTKAIEGARKSALNTEYKMDNLLYGDYGTCLQITRI